MLHLGRSMWTTPIIFALALPLTLAVPLEVAVKNKASHEEVHSDHTLRGEKMFGDNQFNLGDTDVSGSVTGGDISVGHQLEIGVHGHGHGDKSLGHDYNFPENGDKSYAREPTSDELSDRLAQLEASNARLHRSLESILKKSTTSYSTSDKPVDSELNLSSLESSVASLLATVGDLTTKMAVIAPKVEANTAKSNSNEAIAKANEVEAKANKAAIALKCDVSTCSAITKKVDDNAAKAKANEDAIADEKPGGGDSDSGDNVSRDDEGSVYFLAGGYGAERDMTLYHPSVSNVACSTPPPPLNTDWSEHSTFYNDNAIYLCGGEVTASICISHKFVNSVLTNAEVWYPINESSIKKLEDADKILLRKILDTPSTTSYGWKTHTLTTSRRWGHSTVVLQDRVYFIGGKDSSGNYIGAESTALPLTATPVFTPVPNLAYKGEFQCTARIDQDTLVITGGVHNDYLSTVSTYNSRTGAFTQLPQLKQARYNHGCGVWEEGDNKWIIVAGGDNSRVLQTTEMLKLGGSDSEWISMGNLNVRRGLHSMAVTERGVMLIGGWDSSGDTLSSVELLDWNTNTWSLVEPSLDKGRYYFGGAVEIPASMFGCTTVQDE